MTASGYVIRRVLGARGWGCVFHGPYYFGGGSVVMVVVVVVVVVVVCVLLRRGEGLRLITFQDFSLGKLARLYEKIKDREKACFYYRKILEKKDEEKA